MIRGVWKIEFRDLAATVTPYENDNNLDFHKHVWPMMYGRKNLIHILQRICFDIVDNIKLLRIDTNKIGIDLLVSVVIYPEHDSFVGDVNVLGASYKGEYMKALHSLMYIALDKYYKQSTELRHYGAWNLL